ncbi:MAG: hypothetical protein ABSH52_00130 [Terriglobia bacterium]|jgi:hypothetical protein
MLIAIVLIFSLRRQRAITPFLLAYFTIPVPQVLVLGGIHFTMHQILIFTVLARMVAFRGAEGRFAGGFNALDRVAVLWALAAFIIPCVQWMEVQAVIKLLGDLVINLGGYLAVRFLIPDLETLRRAVKVMALICLFQGVCMMSELFTYENVFYFAGGQWPSARSHNIRAEGAMGGLYGGALAGVLIPLFIWLWTERKSRLAACAGIAGATAMGFASHASTAWMAYGGSILGLCFWPLRKQMRLLRWGIVAALIGLHLVMHGPVWSLIEHIDVTGGSSSYHRYMLVDNTIRHFSQWWLLGYRYPAAWGFDMWDLCNQFVSAAVTGGLLTLVLFIMIYIRGFGAIGRARKRVEGDRHQEWFFWCLSSVLFANVVASFGINYLVHLIVCFSCVLACVSAAIIGVAPPLEVKIASVDDFDMPAAPYLEILHEN